jgi:type IV secretory pathway VirB10-like protein
METTTLSIKRIHPLMAAAAVSVIVVSLAGTAAITGMLPSSHSATEPQQSSAMPVAQPYVAAAPAAGYAAPAPYGASAAYPAPAPAMQTAQLAMPAAAPVMVPATYVQSAPQVQEAAPAVHRSAPKRHVVHHYTQARYDDQGYAERQAQPSPRQPNYVAMGTGALIGGLVGNQVGSGNGRKLATVAGIIGGGMLGNEVANRNR